MQPQLQGVHTFKAVVLDFKLLRRPSEKKRVDSAVKNWEPTYLGSAFVEEHKNFMLLAMLFNKMISTDPRAPILLFYCSL